MQDPKPKDHREEVAVFRHGLIGELAVRDLSHGELSAELRRISKQRVRPPARTAAAVASWPPPCEICSATSGASGPR